MTGPPREFTLPPEASGRRLDQALAMLLPEYSRSRVKQWIVAGLVQVDGAAAEPRMRVAGGEHVAIAADAPTAPVDHGIGPESLPLAIVHADPDVLVIDKPPGLVVHPGAGNRSGTLANGLLAHDPGLVALPRCGLVHRLDKDTSGLLVVARTPAAYTALVRAIEAREVEREYRALTVGAMTAGGVVVAPIGRHPAQRTRMAVTARGRPAATHYRVLARLRSHTFIAVRLESGRTHQIRVHLAHARYPLVGDRDYGGRLVIPRGASPEAAAALRGFRRQALHAGRLAFTHPVTGVRREFTSPLPPDFMALLAALAGPAEAARMAALPWPGRPPEPALPRPDAGGLAAADGDDSFDDESLDADLDAGDDDA